MDVTIGWRGFREIDTVLYDPDLISVEQMTEILKRAGTFRGIAENP